MSETFSIHPRKLLRYKVSDNRRNKPLSNFMKIALPSISPRKSCGTYKLNHKLVKEVVTRTAVESFRE